jgi:serine protease Do
MDERMRQKILSAGALAACVLAGCTQNQQTVEKTGVPAESRTGMSSGAKAIMAADTGSEQDFRKIINGAKAKVFPAVVFIRVVAQDYAGGEKVSRESSGSGVIITADGEVLTNWHVVDKAVEVRCLLYDGEAYDATVVGSDKDADLAVIRLNRPVDKKNTPLPYAIMGDSNKLQEGDFVMAMGAPWGLSRSVSLGIISCTKRYLPNTSEYSIWLQTDAAISPGNSGGPLVNTNGEVVGINTRGVMAGGDMGFAVPSETIAPIVEQLRAGGRVNWSWTGLQLQPLKDFNRNMYFEGTEGVMVADTDLESPARKAGIQPRDKILKVNGHPVAAITDEDLPEVRRMLGTLPKSQPVNVEIMRGGKPMTIPLTPREKGKVEGEELACSRWDVTVKTINQFDNPDLYFQRKTGVFVYGIKYPGNAASAGLASQDILLKVNDTPVTTLADVEAAHKATLKTVDDKPRVMLTVLRNGLLRMIPMDISRDYSK